VNSCLMFGSINDMSSASQEEIESSRFEPVDSTYTAQVGKSIQMVSGIVSLSCLG
jgi:hypothetical protein